MYIYCYKSAKKTNLDILETIINKGFSCCIQNCKLL